MKEKLKETTDYFASLYPDIEFSVSRNQTELLDYTISNLQQNLSLGFLFIFIVAVLFLGDVRSPLIIGISMVTSIVITFFFLLFLSCVAECDITFGLDSGSRYDDRQRHYCNGKYFAVS